MRDPDFTLSAGPTMASPRVLAAQGAPVTYHYDPVFLEAFRRTERKVAQIYGTRQEVLLMQGEAILGLEAAARSLVRPGMAVLNLVSGVFGKGMGYWLADFGAVLHEVEVPYNDSVDPADVERYLAQHPEIELVTVVHSETPSGTLNPVEEVGELLERYGEDAVVYCGGTELLLLFKLGFAAYGHLVDVKPIEELAGIRRDNGSVVIGATATHREIERSPVVLEAIPALAAMERRVANIRVRNVGTLGGNLCFSDPHSDPATFLLALDAEVECRLGTEASRRLPIADFVLGPYQTALGEGEAL